jgi:catechol 2,3-dioxygenase-like lactoylglutathione lyase family enzyme
VQLEKGDHARCARLAFQVAPDTEFDDIRRGVEAEGLRCQMRNDPTPGIPRMLAFEDPGNGLRGIRRSDADRQEPAGPRHRPIKLGHLAFVVPNRKEFAAFYTRVSASGVGLIQDWSSSCAAVRIITP